MEGQKIESIMLSVLDVQTFRTAKIDSDLYLFAAKVHTAARLVEKKTVELGEKTVRVSS